MDRIDLADGNTAKNLTSIKALSMRHWIESISKNEEETKNLSHADGTNAIRNNIRETRISKQVITLDERQPQKRLPKLSELFHGIK